VNALAHDLGLALDAVRFAQAAGITPDPWQARLLRSARRRVMLNCTRQAGKSTATSLLALHTGLYSPGALILLLAPALRQSQELFRKVKQAAGALDIPNDAIEAETSLRIELSNGARIETLPGKEGTIRGFSAVSLLIVDEASRVSDELYRAVRPMLAVSGGKLVLLSTPFGRRGFFYEEWTGPGDWERIEVPATEIPRIAPAFLEEERRALGPWYAQEYETAFLDTQFQLYSTNDIDAAIRPDVAPLFGG
jgi:hypothetical protein